MDYKKIAEDVFSIEQEALGEVARKIPENFNDIIKTIMNIKGRCVITGMGKSGLVGSKIAATLASTGTRSFFLHPGEAYHGDLGMIHSEDIIIAISNSGETDEIIKLIPFLKENKNIVIAMTGGADSTLATHSNYLLNIGVTREACPLELAPTSSTTVTMAMGDALAVALMEARGFKAENFARLHPGGSLGRKLLTLVSDVMRKDNLPIVSPDLIFEEVISTISAGRMGIGIVMDNSRLVGLITDGDVRRALKDKKAKALELKAFEFCTTNPRTINQNEKIVVAETLMQEGKFTSLLVLDNEELVGIIQRYDI